MAARSAAPGAQDAPPAGACPAEAPRRRRNASQTRQLLLEVASTRFARDGYATTTVRDIADAAGVNVALINRYFTSKEGLFEACLTSAFLALKKETTGISRTRIAEGIARRVLGSASDEGLHEAMLLLLRSSGDERIDGMRRALLHSMSERLAEAVAGPGTSTDDAVLLRAQIILATTLGMTMLRASLSTDPLASATESDLVGPLDDLVRALLPPQD
ncbi:TetR/AcrR family transcriptional regulator [Symbioplanes lichenis]|uniref:TetR/AcrR family transcriptional regulator n=1 Tax=Symbioplanes lichenis TaxID=1629072 RepID=UPI002739ABEE|nr:TetR/AcrR family transcriptional regulator [Actinoplanes lichenis]